MRNRATATRIVIIVWFVARHRQATSPWRWRRYRRDRPRTWLRARASPSCCWPRSAGPIFSAVLAALFFTLVVNRLAPPTAEVSADALRGNTRVADDLDRGHARGRAQPRGLRHRGARHRSAGGRHLHGRVRAADADLDEPAARGTGHRAAVVVHLPLSHATAASRPHNWCSPSTRRSSSTSRRSTSSTPSGSTRSASRLTRCRSTTTWSRPRRRRSAPIASSAAELCGLWHGNMADNTAMVVSPSDFACLDPAGDDARRADHEVPAAVQPHVRTVANHLRVVMMFDTHSHTRES